MSITIVDDKLEARLEKIAVGQPVSSTKHRLAISILGAACGDPAWLQETLAVQPLPERPERSPRDKEPANAG